MKKLLYLLPFVTILFGCSNASYTEWNPRGGTMTLYTVDGHILKQWKTDGKPEMHGGGHLYCRDKSTGNLVIIYGTYTFEEE